jgi:hypothetical protein
MFDTGLRDTTLRLGRSILIVVLSLGAGCTGTSLLFGPLPLPDTVNRNTELDLAIGVAQPTTVVSLSAPSNATLQWADIATIPGTIVRVQAQRQAANGTTLLPGAFTGPPIFLVGNGTPGTGRDALSDGDSDKFDWDLTGVRVGTYVITATIEAPDGSTKTALSNDPDLGSVGGINVTTTLPAPTLTFTAPGAADVTVTTGNTTNITWTDNGAANASALLTLGLDTDDQHDSGNEVILVSGQALSTDGNTGTFTFSFLDENGATVPDGTYTVFASLDDNANDIVRVEATGKLVLNP